MGSLGLNRRRFLRASVSGAPALALARAGAAPVRADARDAPPRGAIGELPEHMLWLRSARVFLVDAYAYPFTPELEFDAEALAAAMVDTGANAVRIATMGKYATIQGVRFSPHPAQGGRDLLAETVAACKPRGIRVVPYLSTGHKLAWSMVTRDWPQYAHVSRPGGGPVRSRFGAGEDHGTVCWNTPYREAFLDLLERVVRDYAIDAVYFDSWVACYFWPAPATCYCEGCRRGFAEHSGLEIPHRERPADYRPAERETIRRYHAWYQDRLVEVLREARRLVKSHADIPLIYNINNPERLLGEDARVPAAMDAFLYERGRSMLHRAEGVSLARALGLAVWPYVSSGVSSRVATGGLDVRQEILATAAFGGSPIVYNAYQFVRTPNDRAILRRPFSILARAERALERAENHPYIAVVWGTEGAGAEAARDRNRPRSDARSATLGAFAACLRGHLQVASVLPDLLDDPDRLARYRVVYLADLPAVAGRHIVNLREFVARGGGLVVSGRTSLYRVEGPPPDRPAHLARPGFGRAGAKLVRQARFTLEELIRVRPGTLGEAAAAAVRDHAADLAGFQDLYLRARDGAGLPEADWAPHLIPLVEFETVAALEGTDTAGEIVAGEARPIAPGIVLSRHGRGRVAYLAAPLESLYLQTNIAALAGVIRSLVLHVAPDPPPYRVEAPEGLLANLTVFDDLWTLHLVNWTGARLEQAGLATHHLAPVEDVRVRVRTPPGRTLRDLSLLLDAPFRRESSGDCLEILLPRIDDYQAIRLRFD